MDPRKQFQFLNFPYSANPFSSIFLIWLVMVLFFISSSSCSSQDDDIYTICSRNFSCGEITDVGYPFWDNSRAPNCGRQQLELACEENKTTIVIDQVKYQVLELNSSTQTLRLARADYMDSLCPKQFINTTLDYDVFDALPGYQNITLFYCSSSWNHNNGTAQFSCPDYEFGSIQLDAAAGPGVCSESVIMPISSNFSSSRRDVVNSKEIWKAIKEGFEVKWNEEAQTACSICRYTEGVCGYDQVWTVCYCPGHGYTGYYNCLDGPFGDHPPITPTASPPGLDLYSVCNNNSFTCGKINDVGFPFWGDNRPANCGHPMLRLACEGENATIEIMGVKYQVLKLNGSTQMLTIARGDYMDTLCPQEFINTTIDKNLFETVPNYRNITLFYCSSSHNRTTQFSCPDNGIYKFGSVQVDPDAAAGNGACNVSVVMPISLDSFSSASDVVNSTAIWNAIKEGFLVKWKRDIEQGCDVCKESKGVCGYDLSLNRTTCYCRGANEATGHKDCWNEHVAKAPFTPSGDHNVRVKAVIGICVGSGSMAALLCIMMVYFRRRRHGISNKTLSRLKERMSIESIMNNYGPKRYHYLEIKKMTNSFSDKIGEGGYGTVYRGKLIDGTPVAIKFLKVSKGKGEDFINEVMSISRTSHVNIVSLLGFSYNSKKIALVYEFMANGSLDRFMSRTHDLDMKTLHRIVLGVARGLEYLHCGCSTRIVHFDIKPQNILLDEDFNPKISDFGLAKLCKRKESTISMLGTRGTIGFIAPEMFSRAFGTVSYKSDVYSYGMLVLDLVLGGIRNNPNSRLLCDDDSEMYFPNWVFKNFEMGKSIRKDQCLMEDEEEIQKKMIMVGLWCIQTFPLDRPSMSKVLEMLEGSTHSLEMPPKPNSLAPPIVPTQESTSQDIIPLSNEAF